MISIIPRNLEVEEIDFGPGLTAAPLSEKRNEVRPPPPGLPTLVERPDGATLRQTSDDTLVEQLALSLARAILPAFREWQAHDNPELRSLKQLVEQNHEQVQAAIAALQESEKQSRAEAARLREEIAKSGPLAQKVDALSAWADAQQQEIQSMKSGFGDLLPQVDSVVRKLEQQSEAMHRFSQTKAQQDDVLDLLAEGLARWKASRKATQDLQL